MGQQINETGLIIAQCGEIISIIFTRGENFGNRSRSQAQVHRFDLLQGRAGFKRFVHPVTRI